MLTVGRRLLDGGGSFGFGPIPSATLILADCPQPARSTAAAARALPGEGCDIIGTSRVDAPAAALSVRCRSREKVPAL
jgi:hypothetical protein